MNDQGTVLVTGGTGFLGAWCIVALRDSGYAVRTTVRDLAREGEVRDAVAGGERHGRRLEVLAADLTRDDGWAEAVAGATTCSTSPRRSRPAQPKDPDELIVPAREGALRVLRASLDAGVKRVVLTSSVAAVRRRRAGGTLTEDDWSDPDDTNLTPYARSKTAAERAAWELVRSEDATDRLAAINPGAIIGPLLSDDPSFSLQGISRLLEGMPGLPRLGFSWVDVRDVADLHVRAMTSPAAGGERFISVARFLWMAEVAAVLRERLGERAAKVPTRNGAELGGPREWPCSTAKRAHGRAGPGQARRVLGREGEEPARLVHAAGRGHDRRLRREPDRERLDPPPVY